MEIERAARAELASRFSIGAVRRRVAGRSVFAATHANGRERLELHVLESPAAADAVALRRELAGLTDLDHPHIVSILDVGAGSCFLWYSTRPSRGRTLDQRLHEHGPMQVQPCLRLVEQVASGLQFAHRNGVVHGRIRPDCILLDEQGWALLDDFIGAGLLRAPTTDLHARFEAPESAIGLELTPATDQYALAATIIECLTGPPTAGESARSNPAYRIDEIPLSGDSALSEHVKQALRRATLLHPADRFGTVLEFVAALTGSGFNAAAAATPPRPRAPTGTNPHLLFVDGPQNRRTPLGPAVLLVLLGLGGFAIVYMLRDQPPPTSDPVTFEQSTSLRAASARTAAWQDTIQPALVGTAPVAAERRDPPVRTPARTPARPPPVERSPPQRTEQVRERQNAPPPDVARAAAGAQRTRPPTTGESGADTATALAAGRLFISSRPWGQLYVDGRLVGNTPKANLSIAAGVHSLRIVRDGFRAWERQIQVAPGQEIRLVDIVLVEVSL